MLKRLTAFHTRPRKPLKSSSSLKRGRAKEPVLIFELKGKIPSKKNAWKPNGRGGMYLDKALRRELDGLTLQLIAIRNKNRLLKPMEGSIRIEVVFYEKGGRSDLDNVYTTLQDLLQSAGIIKNDRMVEDIIATRIKDGEDRVVGSVYLEEAG